MLTWVKISKELPDKEDLYIVKIYESKMQMYFNGKRFESEEYKTPTYWLKEIKPVEDNEWKQKYPYSI